MIAGSPAMLVLIGFIVVLGSLCGLYLIHRCVDTLSRMFKRSGR